MKNSARLLPAILVAILCATAFSACANNSKPPVTDIPAITTGVLATDAPLVTTEPPVTDAPIVTTETPVTTEPPVTPQAPITTEAPVTEEPDITTEKSILKDVLYYDESGYIKIKDCDSISLPSSGTWLKFKSKSIDKFFASESSYIPSNKTNTSNRSVEWKSENNEIYLSYNSGKHIAVFAELEKLGSNVTNLRSATESEIRNLLLSEATSMFLVGDIVITINNAGKQINSFDISGLWLEYFGRVSSVAIIDANTFYIVGSPRIASGTYYTEMIFTVDAGKTFAHAESYTSREMDPMKYTAHNGKIYLSDITSNSVSNLFVRLTDTDSFKKIISGMQVSPNAAIAYTPHFDNGVGVWQAKLFSEDENGNKIEFFVFYISLDDGTTWELYDPSYLIDINTTTEIEYLDLR